jgi:SNF2-related domain/Bacterial SNF2 helicase associated/Helicase conserved C-terminal domain
LAARWVDPNLPFKAVYSLYHHEHLGNLFSSHVVHEIKPGTLGMASQGLNPMNFKDFSDELDQKDWELVEHLYLMSPAQIHKKFGKGGKIEDFFVKVFKTEVKAVILDYVNTLMAAVIDKLSDRMVGLMGNDGYPAYRRAKVLEQKANVQFHFQRLETETRYFPVIRMGSRKLDFQMKGAVLLCDSPAWLLLNGEIFSFEEKLDSSKLRPFLNSKFIPIPKNREDEYYQKFVKTMIEKYEVKSEGFTITDVKTPPAFTLQVSENGTGILALKLKVHYKGFNFPVDPSQHATAVMEKAKTGFAFVKIFRDPKAEEKMLTWFGQLAPVTEENLLKWEYMDRQEAFKWLGQNIQALAGKKIKVVQDGEELTFHQGEPRIEIEATESGDWFDIKAVVKLGNFSIPFLKLRNNIAKGKRDYVLPDGSIVVLPEEWFTDYRHLLEVMVEKPDGGLAIRKYQAGLLSMISEGNSSMKSRIGMLSSVTEIGETSLPLSVRATLRDYQKKGYDWLHFLRQYNLGGILADDMGLGKTIQGLSLLMQEKEKGRSGTSLAVMPTSLIYNWKAEAEKFTPSLKIFIHTGLNRPDDPAVFSKYDLILTTYGTSRQDEDMLKKFSFHYIILDEGQIIKNPDSKTAKAIRNLVSKHRLSLTGTPIENTLMDLWSQMAFLNPGLLGPETFFRNYYVNPIEKEGNEERRARLKKIIHPFILRRTKEQVAHELPPKVEQVLFCEMPEAQEKLYEKVRSAYRNYLMELSNEKDFNKNKLNLLAGLQKLRQIAIHPEMVEEGREEGIKDSGKFEEFLWMLDEVVSKGSKVLVFSQFVKFLHIVRDDLNKRNIKYCYIDGGTRDRMGQVNKFQEDPSINVFLISLKAGGLGLNLTAAEYVFIIDPWWNPAVENQAIDRSHRIGQSKTVFIYKFISKNTIEEKILKLQEKKSKLSSEIVGTEEDIFKKLNAADFTELLS